MTLRDLLIQHEGVRLKTYRDATGRLTIGVGRNLDAVGISHDEAMVLLDNDIARCTMQAERAFPWFAALDEVRKAVTIDMLFNLGLGGLYTFSQFLDAMTKGDFVEASAEMLDSAWAEQVGRRARDLAAMMQTGQWPDPS